MPRRFTTAALCAAAVLLAVPAEAQPRDPFAALVSGIGKAFAPPPKEKRPAVRRSSPAPAKHAGTGAPGTAASMPAITVRPAQGARSGSAATGKAETPPRANASGLDVLPDKGALRDLVAIYARRHGIEPRVAVALVQAESGFDPWATGAAEEIGLGQIKCETARDVGYAGSCRQLYGVGVNLLYSMKYLAAAKHRSDGTLCGMLSLYNAGLYSGAHRPDYCRRVREAMQ